MQEVSIGNDANLPRLAILCDFVEEGWPSMDLVADELHEHLAVQSPHALSVQKFRPKMRRMFGRAPGSVGRRTGFNLDRLAGRFVDYPVFARRLANQHDMFHIADHSYGHLVHALPSGRCGVFCHDLDTFRCLIEPDRDPRPTWFRKIASRVLSGVQRASIVFYSTSAVRDEILGHGLVPADKLVHAPYGVSNAYAPSPNRSGIRQPYLLHVGSCVARKRIDVLLDVFARVRAAIPDLLLIHVGAPFSAEQERQVDALGVRNAVTVLTGLPRERIAELYSDASLVLLPSDAEGFGLPVIEALACNARVVASDIPVLREVGGAAVSYCAVGDISAWTETVQTMVHSSIVDPPSELRMKQAAHYSWREHSRIVGNAYTSLFESVRQTTSSRGELKS